MGHTFLRVHRPSVVLGGPRFWAFAHPSDRAVSVQSRRPRDRRRFTVSNMPIKIGEVEELFRYPVKSMSGEALEVAELGWHGVDGDRRLAFRRADDRGGFPWLTATKLPDLILFAPQRRGPPPGGGPPSPGRRTDT